MSELFERMESLGPMLVWQVENDIRVEMDPVNNDSGDWIAWQGEYDVDGVHGTGATKAEALLRLAEGLDIDPWPAALNWPARNQ